MVSLNLTTIVSTKFCPPTYSGEGSDDSYNAFAVDIIHNSGALDFDDLRHPFKSKIFHISTTNPLLKAISFELSNPPLAEDVPIYYNRLETGMTNDLSMAVRDDHSYFFEERPPFQRPDPLEAEGMLIPYPGYASEIVVPDPLVGRISPIRISTNSDISQAIYELPPSLNENISDILKSFVLDAGIAKIAVTLNDRVMVFSK